MDLFVQEHLNYLNGKVKLLHDAIVMHAKEQDRVNDVECNEEQTAYIVDEKEDDETPLPVNILSSIENATGTVFVVYINTSFLGLAEPI